MGELTDAEKLWGSVLAVVAFLITMAIARNAQRPR